MAKKKDAMVTSDERKEAAALAELTDFFDDVSTDGMEDVSGEDIKLAVKLFNMGGKDAITGDSRKKNAFFDNVTEEMQDNISCVMLLTHKTHRWDRFDNAKDETEVICESRDRKLGVLRATNETRQCKGCPDRGWFKDPKTGDPMKKCGEVHNVVCIERESGRPFIIRFKKTSLKPFRNYLMQHHFGARKSADGKTTNVPLFAFVCNMTTEMHDTGKYALPIFERGEILSREEMTSMYESAKGFHEMMQEVMTHADNVESTHVASEDMGMKADDFADG